MAKHTPGPWNDGIYHATPSGGRLIAYIRAPNCAVPLAAVPIEVDGYGREEGEANCRIMTAAPEMLQVLIDLLKPGNVNAGVIEVGRDLLARLDHDVRSKDRANG
ncbi:hypothetical protein GR212_15615 [Rhizobium lusitanum]|uniref:Uncharacterized protein n=1 Tax=Rhizobium lusitanum TaxID=293958 RepID=A0A6L9U9N9_9HYPH|nr:hypothetical protein [Rhizobium lusitanum]NEI71006.1 hypothetical protein [Rhizobium lusitanum]